MSVELVLVWTESALQERGCGIKSISALLVRRGADRKISCETSTDPKGGGILKGLLHGMQTVMRNSELQGVVMAIAPLGTSNDVSRSVGWGSFKQDYWKHDAYVPNMLSTVGAGIPVHVDCWQLRVACDKSKSLVGSDLPSSFLTSEQVRIRAVVVSVYFAFKQGIVFASILCSNCFG